MANESTEYIPGGPVFNSKQRSAMRQMHMTGSVMISDTEAITDEGGQQRIAWTDEGSLLLKDDAGVTGITLDSSTNTIIAGNLTSAGNLSIVDVLGSGTTIKFTALPTSDPGVAGVLFVTVSTTMGLGEITGSGFKILGVSQG